MLHLDVVHTRVRSALVAGAWLALNMGITACSDTATATGPESMARIRVVNALFQGASAATSVPVTIDALIDSSMSTPGVAAVPANAVAAGTSAGAGPGAAANAATLFATAGYRDISAKAHSFVARVSGKTGPTSNVYQTSAGTEFLPRQFVESYAFTWIVAGIVPPAGTGASSTAVPVVILNDDPFTPPPDPAGGLMARVQLYNVAPFAVASGAGAKITMTLTGATILTKTATYRASTGFVNAAAGVYTLAVVAGATTLYSAPITLAKGEVRTLVLLSTAFSATPGVANTKLLNILDNQF